MEQQSTDNLFLKKNYYTSIMKSLRPPGSPNIRTNKSGLLNGTTNGFHNRLDPAIPDVGPWDGGPYVGLVTSPSACLDVFVHQPYFLRGDATGISRKKTTTTNGLLSKFMTQGQFEGHCANLSSRVSACMYDSWLAGKVAQIFYCKISSISNITMKLPHFYNGKYIHLPLMVNCPFLCWLAYPECN